jgi:hypothetical protein
VSTTIPRNHAKRIAGLKARLTTCTVYTLDNYFRGQPADPASAWAALERGLHAKLTDRGDGRYTIHIHSNCWYELTA